MDLIKEMAFIVQNDKPKSFRLLIPKDSKMRKLYDLVCSNKLLNDQHAADLIYKSNSADKRFIMLKLNLINKLSELVLIADWPDRYHDSYIKIKFLCEKQLTVASKLLSINVYHNAENATKKVLIQAKRYFLADIELQCLVLLRKINYLKGFPDQVRKYQEKIDQHLKYCRLMDVSTGLIERLLSEIKFTRSQSSELAQRAEEYLKQVENCYDEYKNPFLKLVCIRISLILHIQKKSMSKWEQALKAFDDWLNRYPFLETTHIAIERSIFATKYHVAVRKYNKALSYILQAKKITAYQYFDRFEVDAEQVDVLMKTGNYRDAISIVTDIHAVPQFEQLDPSDKAAWAIKSAYLSVITKIESWGDVPNFPGRCDNHNLQEFFQVCAEINKDKLGFNTQYIVIKTLLLWIFEVIDEDSEGNNLKVYYQRYTKSFGTPRMKVFLKAFSKLVSHRFEQSKFEKLSKNLYDDLSHDKNLDLCELVPYETLWQLVGKRILEVTARVFVF